ncbi:tetratricopeptide repeat protein [Prosthecobacter sp.]|uniref:tetratricopeptide repeat protein n=1 Tax=Prosthecobacter sp. TaxID=1965333 RepID=UPI003783EB21
MGIFIAGGLVVAVSGCGDKKATMAQGTAVAAPAPGGAAAEEGLYLPKELPPAVAKEVAVLLEKEQSWLITPPKDMTPAQLDKAFADLRWEVAQKFGTHDIEGAISYARASLKLDEAQAARWERLGDLYNLSGELTSARDAANAYDNAVFLNPKRVSARKKLAAASLMLGDAKEAARELEFCLYQMPEKEAQELVPLYAAACADAGEYKRGAAFCKIMAAEGGTMYGVVQAILEKAGGSRDEALKLLTEVEQKEKPSSHLSEYVKMLKQRYEKEKGGKP